MIQRPTSFKASLKSDRPTYRQSISVPSTLGPSNLKQPVSSEPRVNSFKNLIQKKFLTKPAPHHFNLMQSVQSGPTINRARQHRMSLVTAKWVPDNNQEKELKQEESKEESALVKPLSSLRTEGNTDSPNSKSKLKRVVFASNVRDTEVDCVTDSGGSREDEIRMKWEEEDTREEVMEEKF